MLRGWLQRLRRSGSRPILDLTWITPDWAVGAAPSPRDLAHLRAAGVSSVLDLRAEAQLDPHLYTQHGLRLLHLPVPDGQAPSQQHLAEATAWVLREIASGHRVLICCRAGSGRSVTLACAVLLAMGYPLSRTMPLIAHHRPVANPTDVQIQALHTFAEHCRRHHPSAGPAVPRAPLDAPPETHAP